MSATVVGKYAILVGGVGLQNTTDVIIIDLDLQLWFGAMVSNVVHEHTSAGTECITYLLVRVDSTA